MVPLDLAPDTDSNTEITAPEGFDARRFPVIGLHHFGIAPPLPWQLLGAVVARVVGRFHVDDRADEAA